MTPFSAAFWAQPIEDLLSGILVWFGWVPIAVVLIWGFIEMFKNYNQGKYDATLKHVLLSINVPSMTEQTPKAIEHLFSALIGAYSSLTWKEIWIIGKFQPTFSFEIVSNEGFIQFYVRTQTKYRDLVEAGIYAQYPEAEIMEAPDYADFAPTHFPDPDWNMWGTELVLSEKDYLPIRTFEDFEDRISGELKDPLSQQLEAMGTMKPGEYFWLQILAQPAKGDWKKKGEEFINETYGIEKKHKESMFTKGLHTALSIPSAILEEAVGISLVGEHHAAEEDQWKAFKLTTVQIEQAKATYKKISKNGFLTKIRVINLARHGVFNKPARAPMVKGILNQYAHLYTNKFGVSGDVTPKDDYFWMRWQMPEKQHNLMRGYKKRSFGLGATPYILNTEELATIWHFPSMLVKAPLVAKAEAKRAEPPAGLPFAPIGESDELGPPKPPGSETHRVLPAHLGSHADESHGQGGGHPGQAHETARPHAPEPEHEDAPHVPESHAPAAHAEEPHHEPAHEPVGAHQLPDEGEEEAPAVPQPPRPTADVQTPPEREAEAPPNLPV